jgi:hypothetical protein
VEASEREAAILELSIALHDASVRAKRLWEDVPEMSAVIEAIRHTGTMLDMVWNLYEVVTFRDNMLDLEWKNSTDDTSLG